MKTSWFGYPRPEKTLVMKGAKWGRGRGVRKEKKKGPHQTRSALLYTKPLPITPNSRNKSDRRDRISHQPRSLAFRRFSAPNVGNRWRIRKIRPWSPPPPRPVNRPGIEPSCTTDAFSQHGCSTVLLVDLGFRRLGADPFSRRTARRRRQNITTDLRPTPVDPTNVQCWPRDPTSTRRKDSHIVPAGLVRSGRQGARRGRTPEKHWPSWKNTPLAKSNDIRETIDD